MDRIVEYITDDEYWDAPPVPVVACYCGVEIACFDDYNECDCGRSRFNRWGQELRPPSEWEGW